MCSAGNWSIMAAAAANPTDAVVQALNELPDLTGTSMRGMTRGGRPPIWGRSWVFWGGGPEPRAGIGSNAVTVCRVVWHPWKRRLRANWPRIRPDWPTRPQWVHLAPDKPLYQRATSPARTKHDL